MKIMDSQTQRYNIQGTIRNLTVRQNSVGLVRVTFTLHRPGKRDFTCVATAEEASQFLELGLVEGEAVRIFGIFESFYAYAGKIPQTRKGTPEGTQFNLLWAGMPRTGSAKIAA